MVKTRGVELGIRTIVIFTTENYTVNLGTRTKKQLVTRRIIEFEQSSRGSESNTIDLGSRKSAQHRTLTVNGYDSISRNTGCKGSKQRSKAKRNNVFAFE